MIDHTYIDQLIAGATDATPDPTGQIADLLAGLNALPSQRRERCKALLAAAAKEALTPELRTYARQGLVRWAGSGGAEG